MTANAVKLEQLRISAERDPVKLSPIEWVRVLFSKTLAGTARRETVAAPTTNHRLKFFIRYCLEQVLALPENQQLTTLTHLLTSIAQEENLRFSQLVFTEDADSPQNWRDLHNPAQTVREVCEKSLQFATNSTELARFKGEIAQWFKVSSLLAEASPVTALSNLKELDSQLQEIEREAMNQAGYQPANLQQITQLKTTINKFAKHPETQGWQNKNIWASAPLLYCMPKSAAHPGGMAVLLITQPFFNIQANKRYLLQTQLLVKLNNDQLARLFLPLPDPTLECSSDHSQQLETWLLEQVVKLEESVQQDHFQIIQQQVEKVSANNVTLNSYPEELVRKYANLFYRLLLEANPTNGKAGAEDVQKLAEFFWQVVFKGLKNPDFIPTDVILERVYRQYQTAEETQQIISTHALFASGFWPAALRVSSISQCVAFTPFSLPMSVLKNSHLLSHTHLAQVIGEERAANWKSGRCQQCGAETWVGECGFCLECEMSSQKKIPAADQKNAIHENVQEDVSSPIHAHSSFTLPRVGLTAFLAGEDTRLIRQQTQACLQHQLRCSQQSQTQPQSQNLPFFAAYKPEVHASSSLI